MIISLHMPATPKKSARSELLDWLGRKDRTLSECRDRLRKKEYAPSEIEEALAWARSRGYLDDRAYAIRFLQGPARRRSYSIAQVRAKLQRLGIDRSVLGEVITRDSSQDVAAALRILQRRAGRLVDPEFRLKARAGLQRRGFAYETIRAAFREMGLSDSSID